MTEAFEAGIRTLLLAHAGFAAVCSERVWPDFVPSQTEKEVLPLCTYAVSYVNDPDMAGAIGTVTAEAQFEVFARDKGEALQVGAQLRSALNGFSGQVGGVEVRSCIFGRQDCIAAEVTADDMVWLLQSTFSLFLDSVA